MSETKEKVQSNTIKFADEIDNAISFTEWGQFLRDVRSILTDRLEVKRKEEQDRTDVVDKALESM